MLINLRRYEYYHARRVNNAASPIHVQGDSILNQALSEIGGKGLFTKELDVALLDNSVSAL